MKSSIHAGPGSPRSGLVHWASRSWRATPSAEITCKSGGAGARRENRSPERTIPPLPVPFVFPWAVSPLLLALLSLLQLFFPGYSTEFAPVPFLVSLFIFGMPHGASDFARLGEHLAAVRWTRVLAPFSLYVAGMGGVVVALLLQPAFSLIAFALLSAWHFGRSDLHEAALPENGHPTRQAGRGFLILRIASRGLLLIAVPLALHPSAVFTLANEWMVILPGAEIPARQWSDVVSFAHLLAWSSLAGQSMVLVRFAAKGLTSPFRRELVEASSLTLALTLLNPVFALGAYFLLWHGLRHLRFQTGAEIRSAAIWLEMCGLDKRASILLIPTLAAYVGLSLYLFPTWRPLGQVALLLIFFAVVTPSHELLNAYLARGREANDSEG